MNAVSISNSNPNTSKNVNTLFFLPPESSIRKLDVLTLAFYLLVFVAIAMLLKMCSGRLLQHHKVDSFSEFLQAVDMELNNILFNFFFSLSLKNSKPRYSKKMREKRLRYLQASWNLPHSTVLASLFSSMLDLNDPTKIHPIPYKSRIALRSKAVVRQKLSISRKLKLSSISSAVFGQTRIISNSMQVSASRLFKVLGTEAFSYNISPNQHPNPKSNSSSASSTTAQPESDTKASIKSKYKVRISHKRLHLLKLNSRKHWDALFQSPNSNNRARYSRLRELSFGSSSSLPTIASISSCDISSELRYIYNPYYFQSSSSSTSSLPISSSPNMQSLSFGKRTEDINDTTLHSYSYTYCNDKYPPENYSSFSIPKNATKQDLFKNKSKSRLGAITNSNNYNPDDDFAELTSCFPPRTSPRQLTPNASFGSGTTFGSAFPSPSPPSKNTKPTQKLSQNDAKKQLVYNIYKKCKFLFPPHHLILSYFILFYLFNPIEFNMT